MDIEFYNKLNQALHGDAGKIDRVMRFRYLNEFVKPGQILFAGSSLMEQFPIQEFVADFDLPLTIYNRGVGGFTTSEMLACMQDCVYALRPAYIFINIPPARQTFCTTATAPFFPASANIFHRQSCFCSPIIRSIRTSPTQA